MASVSGERKRRKTEGDTPNVDLTGELFGGEDSEEEFEGFEISSDEEGEFDDIDKEGWKDGPPDSLPPMMVFEDSLNGLRCEIPDDPTYLDYYKLFLPDHIFRTIAEETNR